jgi:hypothetical protein
MIEKFKENTMSVNGITASNGSFYIEQNGVQQKVDIGTLMMMLNLDYTQTLDKQLSDMVNEMQTRNGKIKAATEILTTLRELKAQGKDDGWAAGAGKDHRAIQITIDGVTKPLQGKDSWCSDLGINYTDMRGGRPDDDDAKLWDDKMEANIQNVKSSIDMMNNDSQLANIKLQNLMEKRNNAFDMAGKMMKTNYDSIRNTTANL